MFNRAGFTDLEHKQLCEVLTINGGTGHAHWSGKQSRDFFAEIEEANSGVVVDGVVYFLMDSVYHSMIVDGVALDGLHPDIICSFDLETVEWREDIQGPISSSFDWDIDNAWQEYIWDQLTLAELKGYLVLVYHRQYQSTMDLWFLTDYGTRT
uniref:F-box associated domain-containing protein n=1 Tax=Arundo donax TaxID=35708 RepID=A0A0A8XY44_ARUDO